MSEKAKLNIEVSEDYKVTSDGLSIIVNERKLIDPTKAPTWAKRLKDAEKKGETLDPTPYTKWSEVSWHGNIESALKSIVDRSIKLSNAQSISELVEEVREIKAKIDAILPR